MSKKLTAVLLCIVLMFSFSTVAHAQDPSVIMPGELEQMESDIMPCFEYTDSTVTSLSISTSITQRTVPCVSNRPPCVLNIMVKI